MKTITREEWADALRSGNFSQTRGQLRSGDAETGYSYCALGVACMIAEIEPNHSRIGWDNERVDLEAGVESCGSLLPKVVADMLELDREGIWMVSDMNDLRRVPFAVIANSVLDLPKGVLMPRT